LSGASNWAVFKACNVSVRLGDVSVFGNLHQVCHGAARDSESENYIIQVMMEAQGRNTWRCHNFVLLLLLKGGVPDI